MLMRSSVCCVGPQTVVADVTYARSLLRKSIGRRAETDESMPLSTLLGIYDDLVRTHHHS
jgi:hypothetical protein